MGRRKLCPSKGTAGQSAPSSSQSKAPRRSAGKKAKAKTNRTPVERDDDCECVVCGEKDFTFREGDWVMCQVCGVWAHEACTDTEFVYVCHLCED